MHMKIEQPHKDCAVSLLYAMENSTVKEMKYGLQIIFIVAQLLLRVFPLT